MDFNFVLSKLPPPPPPLKKKQNPEEMIERRANQMEEKLMLKLISYIFQIYQTYENLSFTL